MTKEEFAVIQTGGKQYKVSKGTTLSIEKIKTTGVEYKKGDKISFDKVLYYSNFRNKLNCGIIDTSRFAVCVTQSNLRFFVPENLLNFRDSLL